MANSLSEGFIRQTYQNAWGVHHAIFPINFDGTPTPGTSPSFTTKVGGTLGFSAALDDILGVYAAFFNDDTVFGLAEVYSVDPDTEERTFIYGKNAGLTGSDGNANVRLAMATHTFKTIAGGLLKLVMMEGVTTPTYKVFAPYAPASRDEALAAYVVSDDTVLIGRDNAYAFSPIATSCKVSDALRKRDGL